MRKLFSKKGLGGIEVLMIAMVIGSMGLAVTKERTGKTSIRELFNDPCENSDKATTGSGSYTCKE